MCILKPTFAAYLLAFWARHLVQFHSSPDDVALAVLLMHTALGQFGDLQRKWIGRYENTLSIGHATNIRINILSHSNLVVDLHKG
ncbi:uncharacterized protein C8R40DRAFT_803324 [Lentinula edodes]|uniref:uncharacterized protein n=1 Tax=Lentinula edodes TaxID=5353 RepID=UPI001E8E88CB|nr:uncharacterized protein C8R40DRAFT_803324 [Lentinula edodes]KAH7868893.1 hypothetical protein C8R40DRAFT_803324 [Lentinula edodes]